MYVYKHAHIHTQQKTHKLSLSLSLTHTHTHNPRHAAKQQILTGHYIAKAHFILARQAKGGGHRGHMKSQLVKQVLHGRVAGEKGSEFLLIFRH